MRGLLIPSLFLVMSVLLIMGCSVTSQADIATKDSGVQQIQTTTTIPGTNSKSAIFSVSDLTIEPREPATGELFAISVTITNYGKSQGNYNAILYIEEIDVEDLENIIIISANTITKSVIIAAGESKNVIFDSLTLEDGIYTATIAKLVDYIEVGC